MSACTSNSAGRLVWLAVMAALSITAIAAEPQFEVGLDNGAVVSLKYAQDTIDTDYVSARSPLGAVFVQYRRGDGDWQSLNARPGTDAETDAALVVESRFEAQPDTLLWTVTARNATSEPLEIGDLALPLPIGGRSRGDGPVILKHGLVSGHMYLEFFCTEPLETLIKKRAAFIAGCQHRDPNKWYDGLISEWNMETEVLLGPDNYDRIRGWRIYEVTCDDPGLSKPAFLASKNAEFPDQNEVEALDYYIENFVWGGLQRTTEETYSYGIYGIPDWKQNRDSNDPGRDGQLHLWRCYDYPHIVVMYFNMYRVARDHPQIDTTLTAKEYLQRAYGTAQAMYTVPMEIARWSAYRTGFYNELVIVDVIAALEAEGMQAEADTLRSYWERKVRSFVNDNPDLFRSEYAFDSTGFESTHALAKYAMQRAGAPGFDVSQANAERFIETQMGANLFCRGWLEPAYYLLDSDYRGSGGNSYTLTYMSQM